MTAPKALWQRNLIGAVVVGAALALLAVTTLWPSWRIYQATVRPQYVVPVRQTGFAHGQEWSVGGIRRLTAVPAPPATPLPAGTVLEVVTVQRSGTAVGISGCMSVLTDGERRWRGEPLSRYAIPAAAAADFRCTKPGPLQWAFLLPADAAPTALDVTTLDGQILVRLQL